MNSDAGWVCLGLIVTAGLVEIVKVAVVARRSAAAAGKGDEPCDTR
jgi:hypothetical protein